LFQKRPNLAGGKGGRRGGGGGRGVVCKEKRVHPAQLLLNLTPL
jgi:hypothetical protein